MGSLRFAALLVSTCVAGCATAYHPKEPRRIAVVTGVGGPALVKDGVVYRGGLFGGDVEEAVQGVEAAEHEAASYRRLMTAGTLTFSLGLGIALVGPPVNHLATRESSDTRTNVDIGLLIGAAVAATTGLILQGVAKPHLYDAANIYNDAVASPRRSDAERQTPISHGGGLRGVPRIHPAAAEPSSQVLDRADAIADPMSASIPSSSAAE
jgi:hypothetical protein